MGNIAFGVGVEFTFSGFEVDAEGLQVLLDAGAEPKAADGVREGEVEVEAATMAALVDEEAAQADVFEVLLDEGEPLGGLAGVVGGVFVDVDDEPAGQGAGANADDAAGVLVQLFLLDGA